MRAWIAENFILTGRCAVGGGGGGDDGEIGGKCVKNEAQAEEKLKREL